MSDLHYGAPNMTTATIRLTRKLIDGLRTNGAFTSATVEALGLSWGQLRKGWVYRLNGSVIPLEQYERAKAGVGVLSREYREMKRIGKKLPVNESQP